MMNSLLELLKQEQTKIDVMKQNWSGESVLVCNKKQGIVT